MKKNTKLFGICLVALLFIVTVSLLLGNSSVTFKDTLNTLIGHGTNAQNVIIFKLRIPRIIAAASAGAALSVAGYLLQNTLNNTLCSPGMLGINNGAGLGLLIYAMLCPYQFGGKFLATFLGALVVTVAIYFLSAGTGMSKTSVVLSGVAISALCLSLIDVIISLKPETVADRVAFQIGGFGALTSSSVYIAVPFIVVAIIVAILYAPTLDLVILGDEVASGLGVNVKLTRTIQLIIASVLSGAAVSMCGIIGFIGLIIPNVVRLFYQGKSRGGLFLCIMIGASFMTVCDTIGRTVVYPYELPCGLFLSVMGAPFLIWLLIKKRKRLGVHD